MQWISVKEKLPKKQMDVLISVEAIDEHGKVVERYVDSATYDPQKDMIDCVEDNMTYRVAAWMPYPTPYQV